MANRKTCPLCIAYLLDHQNLKGWKRCPGCGYAEDAEGYNLISPRPVQEQCFKSCTSETVDCTCNPDQKEDLNYKS
jgi:hypothetical protein